MESREISTGCLKQAFHLWWQRVLLTSRSASSFHAVAVIRKSSDLSIKFYFYLILLPAILILRQISNCPFRTVTLYSPNRSREASQIRILLPANDKWNYFPSDLRQHNVQSTDMGISQGNRAFSRSLHLIKETKQKTSSNVHQFRTKRKGI